MKDSESPLAKCYGMRGTTGMDREQNVLQLFRFSPQGFHLGLASVCHAGRCSKHVNIEIGEGFKHEFLDSRGFGLSQVMEQGDDAVDD